LCTTNPYSTNKLTVPLLRISLPINSYTFRPTCHHQGANTNTTKTYRNKIIYIVYTKLHTNFCSDAFRHLLTPYSGSRSVILFSSLPESDFIRSESDYKHLLTSRCKIVDFNHSCTTLKKLALKIFSHKNV